MTLLVMALASMASLAVSALASPARADSGAPGLARQQELVHLVRQECGFCHGLRLTGGLGSPLDAQAMKERPAEAMVATILHGRAGTAMPGWAPFLSEAEAEWIVRALQEGFPQ
jgi:cytochrome c55X